MPISLLLRKAAPICGPLLCLVALVAWGATTANARTWTNTDDDTIQADLIKIRGRTVFLDQNGKTIRAPIPKLSEEDQKWIEKYQTLKGSRNWTLNSGEVVEGRYDSLGEGEVVAKRGYESSTLKLEELSEADQQYLRDYLPMIEEEVPEEIQVSEVDELSDAAEASTLVAKSPSEIATPAELTAPEDEADRAWHDSRGREISARLVRFDGEVATLWMKDREYKLPIAKLSQADQDYLQQRLADQQVGDSLPTKSPDETVIAANTPAEAAPTDLTDSTQADTESASSELVKDEMGSGSREQPVTDIASHPETPTEATSEAEPDTTQLAETSPAEAQVADAGVAESSEESLPEADVQEEPDEAIAENGGSGGNEEQDFSEQLYKAHPDEPELGEDLVLALCEECETISRMPVTFAKGDPCPHCQAQVTEVIAATDLFEYEEESSGSWIPGRTLRRLIWLVLFLIIGAAAKFFTSQPEKA